MGLVYDTASAQVIEVVSPDIIQQRLTRMLKSTTLTTQDSHYLNLLLMV